MIDLEDILLVDGKAQLQNKVIEDAKIKEADEALLDNWTLKNDGLEIILECGKYLPMSDGTVTLTYSFEELADIIDSSLIIESEKTPETNTEVKLPEDDSSNLPSTTIDPNKPMIALTFDDGPSKHTERLLDMFAKYGGKGTFFVVGNVIENRQETLNRMVVDGHEIGGHSWDHRQLTKLSSADMTDAIMSEVKDGDIILCHDLHGSTVDAMERVIPDLIAQGYQLVTVSELLSYGDTEVNAGTVHTKQ